MSRRAFFAGISGALVALVAAACGKKDSDKPETKKAGPARGPKKKDV